MQSTWVLLALTPAGVSALLAGKGYDSEAIIQAISGKGIEPVIPPSSNRNHPRPCNWFVQRASFD